jgi:chitodextrinase
MWNAASRCGYRRASLALFAVMGLIVTVQVPSAGAASRGSSSTISMTVQQATGASLSISWQPVRKASGYDLYLNGTRLANTQATSYTFTNLRCGTTYTLGVGSFNAKGARSTVAAALVSTTACPIGTGGNDTTPPTSPTSLSQGATTATSISLLWGASQDNVGVAGYELFLNGNKVGSTAMTSYTFANLSCGTSTALAVDAFDGAGNRSQSTVVQASTAPCADVSPPTTPALPTQSAATSTSISLAWGGSLDNVGVAGYELFLNGNKVGSTATTSYTFGNLSCGTSYTLAVDAFDAAGNRSPRPSLSAATSPCTNPPSPPSPTNCTATLAAGGDAVSFFNRLSPGDVGCLHGGTYGSPSTFSDFTKSGTSGARITLMSYPGETATLSGYLGLDASYVTFTRLRIDNTNTFRGSSECGGRYESFTIPGSHNIIDHSEITASNIAQSSNGMYITGSNEEIRFNEIHGVGSCLNYDHGIYIGSGSGTTVDGNWIWNIPHGWGVQVYPSSSDVHAYSNVIDGAQNGFVLCSTGSNNLVEHNVVTDSTGSPGAAISGCSPQGSSTSNVVSSNDQWNNPGGFGSVSGITYSGNTTADPRFVDSSSHDYQTSPTSPLLSWGLWDGS